MPFYPPARIRSTYYEGEDIWTLWRPKGADGTLIVDSMVTNWDLYVYPLKDSGTPLTAIYSITAQSVSGIMFSSAQTPAGGDGYWDEDPDGYTFRHQLAYSAITGASQTFDAGKKYLLEYLLHTATYGQISGIHEVAIESLRNQ